jgi:hypothetical protein
MSIINRTHARADAGPTNGNAQGAGNPKGAQINKSHQHDTGISYRLKALMIGIAEYDAAMLALLFLIVWGALR